MRKRKPKFKRVWLIFYRIDGEWQTDGEWWASLRGAREQATENYRTLGWNYVVDGVDVPESTTRALALADKPKRSDR